jgi:hypothetical protein
MIPHYKLRSEISTAVIADIVNDKELKSRPTKDLEMIFVPSFRIHFQLFDAGGWPC